MPRQVFIHRDTALDRTGYVPARKPTDTDAKYEHRIAATIAPLPKAA